MGVPKGVFIGSHRLAGIDVRTPLITTSVPADHIRCPALDRAPRRAHSYAGEPHHGGDAMASTLTENANPKKTARVGFVSAESPSAPAASRSGLG